MGRRFARIVGFSSEGRVGDCVGGCPANGCIETLGLAPDNSSGANGSQEVAEVGERARHLQSCDARDRHFPPNPEGCALVYVA